MNPMPIGALEHMARRIEESHGGHMPEACTLHAAATLAEALDRNTAALETINETLNLIREDRLREGT